MARPVTRRKRERKSEINTGRSRRELAENEGQPERSQWGCWRDFRKLVWNQEPSCCGFLVLGTPTKPAVNAKRNCLRPARHSTPQHFTWPTAFLFLSLQRSSTESSTQNTQQTLAPQAHPSSTTLYPLALTMSHVSYAAPYPDGGGRTPPPLQSLYQ